MRACVRGLDCGTLNLVSGKETVYRLGFIPFGGVNGITLGNPKVVASTLFKQHPGASADQFQLSLKALTVGLSSITICKPDGEVAAHFDLVSGTTPSQPSLTITHISIEPKNPVFKRSTTIGSSSRLSTEVRGG